MLVSMIYQRYSYALSYHILSSSLDIFQFWLNSVSLVFFVEYRYFVLYKDALCILWLCSSALEAPHVLFEYIHP